jgi:hypothetical protein
MGLVLFWEQQCGLMDNLLGIVDLKILVQVEHFHQNYYLFE